VSSSVAACWLAAACAGCGGDARPAVVDLETVKGSLGDAPAKIALIGLDGADWNVLGPLIDQGRVPTLASLVREGTSAPLESLQPMISPALWTTVVTGVPPSEHGILDFVYKRAGSYDQPIVKSTIRERLALWNILSSVDRSVGIVDWYATFPAEEVRGFIVSDRMRSMGLEAEGVTYPPYEELAPHLDRLPPLPTLPALDALTAGFESLPAGLEKALAEDLHRYRIALGLYRDFEPDFFAFYLKGLDALGHFYWKYFEPDHEVYFGEVDREEIEALGPLIPLYYELCDQLLGALLAELDDETVVIVVSDHGFRAFGRPENLIFDVERLFSLMGLLEFEDPARVEERSGRSVSNERSRLLVHKGTQIVSVFGERDIPVYLNVEGREPEGVLDAADWRRQRDEIERRLKDLRTDRGTRVFSSVRVHDAEARGPRQEADLWVRANRDVAFDRDVVVDGRSYPVTMFLWEYGNISGTHRDEGILIARGPGIRAGARIDGPSLLDVAPTVLHLAGLPVPDDLAGRPIRGMLVDPGAGNPLRLASYEPLVTRPGVAPPETGIDEEYLERIRSLGYVQ
jgi:predicted AlkP superfamily phosphohydrolase/phosphomutase